MGDRYEDDDSIPDSVADISVRKTFLRAGYDVEAAEDRKAYAEDMAWARGHKKYTTLRSAKRWTVLFWFCAAVGTALISQSIPSRPFVELFKLFAGK